jgi:quercetin dioxygenase-like cupin family protein
MEITRSTTDTATGPGDWFTGAVYLDPIATPSAASRVGAASVHFTPGARTAWHTHPHGQTIWVLEGVGCCQRRGGPIEVIRPGDRVFFEPGEEHWHGAAANRFMTHLALHEVGDDGRPATWGDHVSDEEYGAAPAIVD